MAARRITLLDRLSAGGLPQGYLEALFDGLPSPEEQEGCNPAGADDGDDGNAKAGVSRVPAGDSDDS